MEAQVFSIWRLNVMFIYDVVFFPSLQRDNVVMKFLVLCEKLGSFRQQMKIYCAYRIKRKEIKCRECMWKTKFDYKKQVWIQL